MRDRFSYLSWLIREKTTDLGRALVTLPRRVLAGLSNLCYYVFRFFYEAGISVINAFLGFPYYLRRAARNLAKSFGFQMMELRFHSEDRLARIPRDLSDQRKEVLFRLAQRATQIFVIGLILVGGLAAAGKWIALPQYRAFKSERLVGQAESFLAEGDFRGAFLTLRQALVSDFDNIQANELMANLGAMAFNADTEMLYRERIIKLKGLNEETFVPWVDAVIRYERWRTWDNWLTGVLAGSRETDWFRWGQTRVALARGQDDVASVLLSNLLNEAPDEEKVILAKAKMALSAGRVDLLSGPLRAVRTERDSFSSRGKNEAAMILLQFYAQQGQQALALGEAQRILGAEDATMVQRVIVWRYLRAINHPRALEVGRVLPTFIRNSDDFRVLGEVFLQESDWNSLAELLAEYKERYESRIDYRFLASRLAYSRGEYQKSFQLLGTQRWNQNNHLRLAWQALARWRLEEETEANLLWRRAVESAEGQTALTQLIALAQAENRPEWRVSAGWRWLDAGSPDPGLFPDLFQSAMGEKNSARMERLLRLRKDTEKTPAARSDWARIALLLKVDETEAKSVARQAFLEEPANLYVRLAYVLAEMLDGNLVEAKDRLGELGPENLRGNAAASYYYGVLLESLGEHEAALPFLEVGRQGNLMREEIALRERLTKNGPRVAH